MRQTDEDENFYTLNKMLINLKQDGKTLTDIDENQTNTLLQIADSKSNAAYKAQALLYRAQGTEFDVLLPELPNAIGSGGHTVFKTNANTAILTLVQPFVPNPVAQLAILAYNLTSESEATLYITDISGKIIRQATLKGSGNYSLNTQTISNGLYLYTVVQDGNVLLRDKLIILK